MNLHCTISYNQSRSAEETSKKKVSKDSKKTETKFAKTVLDESGLGVTDWIFLKQAFAVKSF